MGRSRGRKDGNQDETVAALRGAGASVAITSGVACRSAHLKGYPDLTVGHPRWTGLMEVKRPGEELTDDEKQFRARWRGNYEVVDGPAAALRVLQEAE